MDNSLSSTIHFITFLAAPHDRPYTATFVNPFFLHPFVQIRRPATTYSRNLDTVGDIPERVKTDFYYANQQLS